MEEISCFFLEKIVYVCSGKVIIHERRRMGTTGIVHTLGFHPIPKKRKKRTWKQIMVGYPPRFNTGEKGTPSQPHSAKSVWLASPELPLKKEVRKIEKRNDISPTPLPKYFLRQTMRTGRQPLKQWKGISIQNAGRKEYLFITFLLWKSVQSNSQ